MNKRLDRELREAVDDAVLLAQFHAYGNSDPMPCPCTCIHSCLTVLQKAIAYGSNYAVRAYFDRGDVDINEQTRCGRTLLELAQKSGSEQVLAIVLARVSKAQIENGLATDSESERLPKRSSLESGIL